MLEAVRLADKRRVVRLDSEGWMNASLRRRWKRWIAW